MTYEETKLSVIIVNYNVKYFLEQCLYSVRAAVTGMDAEVFVVDNNSTDGSLSDISGLSSRRWFSLRIKIIPVSPRLNNRDSPVHRGIRVIAESRYRGGRGEPPQPVLPDG